MPPNVQGREAFSFYISPYLRQLRPCNPYVSNKGPIRLSFRGLGICNLQSTSTCWGECLYTAPPRQICHVYRITSRMVSEVRLLDHWSDGTPCCYGSCFPSCPIP